MKLPTVYTALFLITTLATAKQKISLQWALCDPSPQSALPKLGLGTSPPYKQNPITYYDTQTPTYISSSLMFRTKTNKGQHLSTVKAGFHDEKETLDVPDFVECAWVRYGDERSYTCEKRCPLVDESTIWCDEQVLFAGRYEDIDWDGMIGYGPYQNAKWKVRIEGYKTKFDDVVAGSLHLMEIEAKVPIDKGDEAYDVITKFLRDRGVVLCDKQEGKTKRLFRAMGYIDERSEL